MNSQSNQSPDGIQFDTPQQLADDWQLSTKTVLRLIKKGDLIAHKFGRQWRISPADRTNYERLNRLG